MNPRHCNSQVPASWLPLALTVILLAGGCSRQQQPHSEPIRPVKTMVVTAGNEPQERSFPGKVEASSKAELAFQVPGVLVRLPVKEGQRVGKGALIAQIRQDEFQARLETAVAQLDQAPATLAALRGGERTEEQLRREAQERAAAAKLANAKTDFERYGRLVKSSAVSQSEYEISATAYRVSQEE